MQNDLRDDPRRNPVIRLWIVWDGLSGLRICRSFGGVDRLNKVIDSIVDNVNKWDG